MRCSHLISHLIIAGLILCFIWPVSGTDLDDHITKCKRLAENKECDDKLSDCCHIILDMSGSSQQIRKVVNKILKDPNCLQPTHGGVSYTSKNYNTLLSMHNESIMKDKKDTWSWNEKGIALGELNRLDESIACFDEVIRISNSRSEVARAWNNIGVSMDKLGGHAEALEAYDSSIQIDSGLAEAWHNKGKTLSLDVDMYDAAHECDQNALRINPELTGGIGWIYAEF